MKQNEKHFIQVLKKGDKMQFNKLRELITEYCESNNISGCIRITICGKNVYEQYVGFSDAKNKLSFTNKSMFTLYSLSKPFCAIGLLKLKEKSLVDIDTLPSKYVPEAAGFDDRITIRNLLHHTSGLPDFEQNQEFAKKYAPGYAKYTREHLKILTNYPSFFAPGTDSKYANINFVLCALIIENVSGMHYSEYMQKEIFKPLGMKNAVVDNEELIIPNRVKGYELSDNKPCETNKSHNWLLGAGDIVATIDDVYCLNKAIKNNHLLSRETWHEILTPSPINNMGMGCTISDWHGKKRITHNGGHTGFRTLHIQLPEDDFDLIFLSNSGFGDARNAIAEIVHSFFYGESHIQSATLDMDKGYI